MDERTRETGERSFEKMWGPARWRRLWVKALAVSIALHLVGYFAVQIMMAIGSGEVTLPAKLRFSEPPPPTAVFRMSAPPQKKAMILRKQVVPQGKPMVQRQARGGAPRLPAANSEFSRYSSGLMGTRNLMPEPTVGNSTGIGESGAVAEVAPAAITSFKEPEKRISMQEEFLDLEALDIGKYKGMVIQDPGDKQNISGFVYLALVWGNDFKPATQRAISELVEAINNLTQIRAQVDEHMFLDSRNIFRAPFVYLTVDQAFNPTEREIENLRDYLHKGGFALVENARPELDYSPAEASLRQLLKSALGRDARFQVIPNDHPIYHSFFDFADGPPPQRSQSSSDSGQDFSREAPYLEGIYLGDRLVVVFSNKAYGKAWEKEYRNEPQLQIGVNLVVFALTQQGSIAQQQIDFYKETTR